MKQAKMLKNIEEVLDEKRQHQEMERSFYQQPNRQVFPYDHGDKVELGRMAIREELNRDLKNL